MKICYCIKSHYKTDDCIKRYFKKFESFKFFINNPFNMKNEDDYLDRVLIVESDNSNCIYRKEQFEKYFTTDIKIIRKMKLDKIKKSSSI